MIMADIKPTVAGASGTKILVHMNPFLRTGPHLVEYSDVHIKPGQAFELIMADGKAAPNEIDFDHALVEERAGRVYKTRTLTPMTRVMVGAGPMLHVKPMEGGSKIFTYGVKNKKLILDGAAAKGEKDKPDIFTTKDSKGVAYLGPGDHLFLRDIPGRPPLIDVDYKDNIEEQRSSIPGTGLILEVTFGEDQGPKGYNKRWVTLDKMSEDIEKTYLKAGVSLGKPSPAAVK